MKNLLTKIIIALLVVSLGACHSKKSSTSNRWEDPIYARREPPREPSLSTPKTAETRGRVIEVALGWIGVPYSYGGNSRKGVDCSGLVCIAFEEGAGIKLPRSSAEQAARCKQIKRENARPGDLIFFTNKRGGGRINHVAIYLGDERVVHSTSSRGVVISSLDETYWATHYYSCGRVLD